MSFSIIEKSLQNDEEKYTVHSLLPKGIVLAKIGPGGNTFTDGVMDGHPDILRIGFGAFCNNLFQYCIRLARLKACDILDEFWRLFDEEATRIRSEAEFRNRGLFIKSAQRLLKMKEYFTSQELFVLFHLAYGEMLNGGRHIDISQKIIYWEPHFLQRAQFTYLASWLESDKFKGYSLVVRRDNLVWVGSICKRMEEDGFINLMQPFDWMFWTSSELDKNLPYYNWEEFKVRFEDMKLCAKEKLVKICEKVKIPWSDTMLQVTELGEPYGYRGSINFDLKPVFNKYEDYLSAFDRFRISLACRTYQRRYGYTYENSLQFSRKELRDMFLKRFRFQDRVPFESLESEKNYFLTVHDLLKWELWEVRKQEILGEMPIEFNRLEAGQQVQKCNEYVNRNVRRINKIAQDIREVERKRIKELIRNQKKLVFYGTGRDCEAIIKYLSGTERTCFLFCDKKAGNEDYVYCGQKVLAPKELLNGYMEYKILITSSRYYKLIQYELEKMGIKPDRIFCNTVQFWDD